MKKIILAGILLATFQLNAQNSKVVSTYNYLKSQELDKAKEAIDEATENPATSDFWKTYYFRGDVYYELALTQNDEFKKLAEDPILEAYRSYKKVYEYDSKKINKNELNGKFKGLIPPAFSGGVTKFNEKDFKKAYEFFNVSRSVSEHFGVVDTLSLFNMALSASQGGDYETALQDYRKCIELEYKPEIIYLDMANIHITNNNDDKAFELLKEARSKFPTDQNLLTTELNLYLKNEKFDEAIENLDLAIKTDPENYIFYYARGTLNNNKGRVEAALEDFKKCIELKDDYFDAYYNMGAILFNQAVELNDAANAVPPSKPKEYDEKKAVATAAFEEAMPFLEKAHSLKEEDVNTMNSLKQLYAITKRNDKYMEMDAKIKAK